jgi:hypothetical protein
MCPQDGTRHRWLGTGLGDKGGDQLAIDVEVEIAQVTVERVTGGPALEKYEVSRRIKMRDHSA